MGNIIAETYKGDASFKSGEIATSSENDFADAWSEYSETLLSRIPLNSRRALAYDLKDYFEAMDKHLRPPLSGSLSELSYNIRLYVTYLTGTRGLKNSTIRRRISSVRKFMRLKLSKDPVGNNELLKEFISRELAINSFPAGQAIPVRAAHLSVMNSTFIPRRISDLRAKLMMNIAYDTLARCSEIQHFRIENINSDYSTNAHSILIANAKNDQAGVGSARFISQTTYRFLSEYLEKTKLTQGLLFRKLTKHDSLINDPDAGALHYQTVARDLTKIGQFVDFGGRKVTGHSYRVGAVQDMVVNGYTNSQISIAGGWNDETMPAYYARMLRANESAAADMARKLGR